MRYLNAISSSLDIATQVSAPNPEICLLQTSDKSLRIISSDTVYSVVHSKPVRTKRELTTEVNQVRGSLQVHCPGTTGFPNRTAEPPNQVKDQVMHGFLWPFTSNMAVEYLVLL